MRSNKWLIIGLTLLAPALLLEAAGMSKFYWSPTNPVYLAFETVFSNSVLSLFAQAVVLIGPSLAVALALLPILRVNVQRADGTLVSTIALKLNALHFVVIAFGLLALAVIALYAIGENAPCVLGYAVSC
ncbi:MAG: hypothetical protein LC737_02805 [Chloroflexi bacterium]|nr:hypothetical protein [Chloroflexota bacterium]